MSQVPPIPTVRTAAAREQVVAQILARVAVAVVRLPDTRLALEAIRAVVDGGVTAIELTMTTPGALDLLEELARWSDGRLLLGAGTVLGSEATRRAIGAGAAFVVTPVFVPEVIREGHRLGVPVIAGAFTPTEIYNAHLAGADLVKVFPAETLGAAHIKGVLAPMPFLRLMPTGGVTPENVGTWLRAGSAAVGLGSALVDPTLVAAGDLAALAERARRVTAAIAEVRE